MTDVTATSDRRSSEHTTAIREEPESEDLVYSLNEAANLLRIGRTSLYELLAAEELRSIKIGSRRLVAREDIEAFIASRRSDYGAA